MKNQIYQIVVLIQGITTNLMVIPRALLFKRI
jgi:hypothetical protein